MEKKTWVFAQPFHDLHALVDTQVVANDMNRGDVIRDLGIQIFQEADELQLSFAPETPAVNVTCPSIKRGKEVESSLAYSCSTRTDFLGFAGLVGCFRVRGCKEVFSSTLRTISWG